MKYEAAIYQMTVETHTFWVAESKVLKGCVGQGDTSESAIKELEQNEIDWIKTAEEVGIPIPEETAHIPLSFSGKVALRLSPNIHAEASKFAKEMDISLNHYLCDAIASYNATIKAMLYNPIIKKGVEKITDLPVNYHPRKSITAKQIDELEEI